MSQKFAYRPEIDGLRALAIIPVVLMHAGFKIFSGGFVGVDIFFVISGYLITSIIMNELNDSKFSVVKFYERRIRRILPALYIIITFSCLSSYILMMPDEFKNFGQSIVATTLFSNNVLLSITSNYWDLASDFKPLLHTWSLGVEEQFYFVFPFILFFISFRYSKKTIRKILSVGCFASLALACLTVSIFPTLAFYLLPTRAWELLFGAIAALHMGEVSYNKGKLLSQILGIGGILLIFISVFFFDENYPSPGIFMLAPTCGALAIILFATDKTLAGYLLGNRFIVSIGLISYSLYLWHQPLLSFVRIYSVNEPSNVEIISLIFICFLLSIITYRYIEMPFRDKNKVSSTILFSIMAVFSVSFLTFGYVLNRSYGLPGRVNDPTFKQEDMDKRIYNERVFSYKKDAFRDSKKLKLLVAGNSFSRDFVNITIETFNTNRLDIVYRDDISECALASKSKKTEQLVAAADLIVFASGKYNRICIEDNLRFERDNKKTIFYIGTKNFGYNLNWLIRLDRVQRANKMNLIPQEIVLHEKETMDMVPVRSFISLLGPISKAGRIPITDGSGRLLSTDRAHLTKYGAKYFGEHAVLNSAYGRILSTATENER
jgi:peptidoglycan/LPS O-acetylase OafA/YrhL